MDHKEQLVSAVQTQSWNQALTAAVKSIEDYIALLESHTDQGGIVTGPDFNVFEIDALRVAMDLIRGLRK